MKLETISNNREGDLAGLAEINAKHKEELAGMVTQLKKTASERDELIARLDRLKESHKSQIDEVVRERLNVIEERDKATVRLEKAREDLSTSEANFDTERQYLIKERDKVFAQLDETRKAQKALEQTLDENSPLAQELAVAEKTWRALDTGKNKEAAAKLDKLFGSLRARLRGSQQQVTEVSKLESFKLTPAEKLLARHKYELGSEISRDKSIVLYRAKDMNISREVTMKLVGDDAASRDAAIAQLIAEAQMIGRLEHPNIQPLHELSVDDSGRAFYTAKPMKGSTLAKILDDLRAKKSSALVAFDLKKILSTFHGVCDAVAFAHSEGIVHGRLSAEHIQMGDYGEVLVTGWEMGRKIREGNVNHYEADVRVDIAALGDLLYHILTLTPPAADKKEVASAPHANWKMPKGLWTLTQQIRSNRGATAYPRVAKLQTEVEDFRDELGPRGGRASAFDVLKQSVQKWQ